MRGSLAKGLVSLLRTEAPPPAKKEREGGREGERHFSMDDEEDSNKTGLVQKSFIVLHWNTCGFCFAQNTSFCRNTVSVV